MYIKKLKMNIFNMLCLKHVYVYVKNASVWSMMNMGLSMYKSQCIELWLLCIRCAHMYSYTHFEWSDE